MENFEISRIPHVCEKLLHLFGPDKVRIEDILELNLSDNEASLLALRLENATTYVPLLLGTDADPQTYELTIRCSAESIPVLWALTVFWSLTKGVYADLESMYLSDVLSDLSKS